MFKEKFKKHDNKVGTTQFVQYKQSHMPQKNDIYSQVKGLENKGHVCCLGKISNPKNLKASLS